jgi:MoxR-like ATPase
MAKSAAANENAVGELVLPGQPFDRKEVLQRVLEYKFPPTATFPDGVTVEDLVGMAGNTKSVVEKMLAVMESGLVGFLIGAPGVGKSALVRMLATIVSADVLYFGPNSSPDKYLIPGLGRGEAEDGSSYEFLDYLPEAIVTSPNAKITYGNEVSRMYPSVQQQMLEVNGPKPRISGVDLPNIVGRFIDGNRVEDGVEPLDPALATRVVTIEVNPEATGWQYHVSAMFPDDDLTEVFRVHQNFTPEVRAQVSPRKVVKIVRNLRANGSGWPALMLRNSQREVFVDASGADVTAEVLDAFARALGTPNRDTLADPVDDALRMVRDGGSAYIEGPPGIAKTSYSEARLHELDPDADILVVSMANASPEDWSQTMIVGGELQRRLLEFFARPVRAGVRKYVIFDEIGRAPDDVKDQMLELTQERTIGGRPTGVHGIVALNNTADVEGVGMDVTPLDTAQADRFDMNLKVTAADIPWESYLLTTYGQAIEPFTEWWKDLSAKDQALYPLRCLEAAYKWWLAGMSLADTRPWYDGKPYDISFHELERALADRPLVKIREVASRADEFAAILAGPNGQQTEEHLAVYDAFDRADIVQLREHRDACEKLMPLLSQQSKINLLRSAKSKRRFWLSVVNGEAE